MALPILCYHKVGPIAEEGRWLNVEPATLDEHVRYFARRGRFVRAEELAGEWPERAVCLTFDDAYLSTLTHGLEVLMRHQAAASIFAVPSLVGGRSPWDHGEGRPLAGIEELRQAHAAGIEIGNHTLTHANFNRLSLEAQVAEIGEARARLIEWNLNHGSVAYPFGQRNVHTPAALEAAGYAVGLGLGWRRARPTDDRRLLPRIVVSCGDRLPKLLYKIYLRAWLPRFKARAHYVR